MKFTILASLIAASTAFAPAKQQSLKTSSSIASSKDDLVAMAEKLNPVVKYFDPMGLADDDFWGMGSDATIAWLRQSEIKHGRIAMFAFVGYCVQSNFVLPWPQHLDGTGAPGIDLSPEQQWDALPEFAKWQIFGVIFLLEMWDETGGGTLEHYTKGRQPGKYPSGQNFRDNVHFALDLYDPLGFSKKKTDEQKAKGLIAETNNGRLAMLGIFGFLSADKVPGSVPALDGIAIPYDGNCMVPFEGNFHLDGLHAF